MNLALVKNTQHDIDGYERRQNQYRLVAQRRLERCRSALKRGLNTERHSDFLLGLFNRLGRFAQGSVGRQIEGQRHHRELSLMVDRQRRGLGFKGGESAKRNGGSIRGSPSRGIRRAGAWQRRRRSRRTWRATRSS